jgi:hypothetical protein
VQIIPTVNGEVWLPATITHYTVTSTNDAILEIRVTLAKDNPNLSENMRGGVALFTTGRPGSRDRVVIMDGDYRVFDSETHLKEHA